MIFVEKYIEFIIAILYLILAILVHLLSFSFIKKATVNILLPIDQTDQLQESILVKSSGNSRVTEIIEQYYIAANLKLYFRNLAISFYQNYYVFTICSIVYTILLSISVFVLAGKGWQNSTCTIQVIVMMTTVFGSFYYFLPSVLNNKMNLNKNMEGVKTYQRIQFDILSFLNNMNENVEESEINLFATNIYKAFKENYDYNISLDTSLLGKNPLDNFKGMKG